MLIIIPGLFQQLFLLMVTGPGQWMWLVDIKWDRTETRSPPLDSLQCNAKTLHDQYSDDQHEQVSAIEFPFKEIYFRASAA